ncbi:hypothetical protein [Streptomyces bacillaris]|uniref:hypothetical protein n=1 Tax=Streptomyces bacillaris TaxID=68179 RepID=UPI0036500F4B
MGAIANQFGGDIAQRCVDAITAAWAEEEGNRIGEKATEDRKANHEERNLQLRAIADHWYAENTEWAEEEKDFSPDRGVYTQIRDAADHGNDKVNGVGGEK